MTLMAILYWLAACGAVPNPGPPETDRPKRGNVFDLPPLRLISPTTTSPGFPSLTPDSDLPGGRLTVRSQSLDTGSEFVLASPDPREIHRDVGFELFDTSNPFTRKSVRVLPGYYDPYGWQGSYGTDGYQPWRLGWGIFHEWAIQPFASTSGGTTGEMKIVEWNDNFRLSELIAPGTLFNGTAYVTAHYWDGPGGTDLPGQVNQFSYDMELGLFNEGPWSAQIAFHPQIVDGYRARLNHQAFNFDGRAIASYLWSPHWTFVGGVAFWDRVDLLVVPHVGVVWTPKPRWELRLLYPKSRISYFVGRRGRTEFWVYGVAEYTAEAWQANIGTPTRVADRIQLTDNRLSLGLRWDSGRHSVFVEGGYVFNRRAKFAESTPDFDISDVGMLRVGVRF